MTDISALDAHEEQNFVVFNRTQVQDIYADGVAQMLTGATVTKLILYSVLEPPGSGNDNKEVRRASYSLTIPTLSLLEFANNLIANLKTSQAQLVETDKQIMANITRMLDGVVVAPAPKP